MAVPRIATALVLGACAAACGQAPEVPAAWAARLASGQAVVEPVAPVIPPLLPVPPTPEAVRRPCLPCQTEYQPNHVYLPDANPDGAGGCDGECRACRRYWVSLAGLLAGSTDLGGIRRGLECGVQGGAGYWFDDSKTLGLEVGFLNVHKPDHEIFFDTFVNAPLTVTTADANARLELMTFDRYRLDGLVGYRYAQLHEHLFVNSARGFAADQDARNTIQAAQVGLVGTYRYGAYFCEVLGKVGVGRNSESVTLNGLRLTDSTMALVPEFGARAGYQIGEGVYWTLGYTFLYLTNVARPGEGETGYYVHGFSFGIECRF